MGATADVPLVNEGTLPTVSVNDCLVTPAAFVAVNLIGNTPAVEGTPDNVAVPSVPALNVMPFGNDPVVIVGTGEPVVVTVNEKAVPASVLAEAGLVNCGSWATVSTICRVRIVAPLIAVMVSGYDPAVPTAGVPLIVPAPGAGANVTPAGSAPASETVGAGTPVAVMLIVPARPTTIAVLPVMLIAEPGRVPVVVGWWEPGGGFGGVGLECCAGDGGAGWGGEWDGVGGGVGDGDLSVLD